MTFDEIVALLIIILIAGLIGGSIFLIGWFCFIRPIDRRMKGMADAIRSSEMDLLYDADPELYKKLYGDKK